MFLKNLPLSLAMHSSVPLKKTHFQSLIDTKKNEKINFNILLSIYFSEHAKLLTGPLVFERITKKEEIKITLFA